jgi:hypothetical protein
MCVYYKYAKKPDIHHYKQRSWFLYIQPYSHYRVISIFNNSVFILYYVFYAYVTNIVLGKTKCFLFFSSALTPHSIQKTYRRPRDSVRFYKLRAHSPRLFSVQIQFQVQICKTSAPLATNGATTPASAPYCMWYKIKMLKNNKS